jgi:hypothetical protein
MKKRFIVLIDFSDHSRQLLLLVNAWARKTNAELILVHQVVRPIPAMGDSEIIAKLKQSGKEDAFEDLKSFTKEALGDDSGIRYLADTNHLISIIESLNEVDTIDCIFVGMNDKTIIDRLFLRSTAAELSKQLDKIIFAFPTYRTDINVDTLYVGISEQHPLNEKAFQTLATIMGGVINEIQFFSIIKPADEQEKAERYLETLQVHYKNHVNASYAVYKEEHPMDAVKDYMLKNKGFLVIQKGSRSLLDVFRKFWTTEMIYNARIPIIILPNNTND